MAGCVCFEGRPAHLLHHQLLLPRRQPRRGAAQREGLGEHGQDVREGLRPPKGERGSAIGSHGGSAWQPLLQMVAAANDIVGLPIKGTLLEQATLAAARLPLDRDAWL